MPIFYRYILEAMGSRISLNINQKNKMVKKKSKNVMQNNDVVIIIDPNLPRNNWPKGIVRTVYKSKDGNVRKVANESSGGLFIRPVAKLAKMDVRSSNDS